MQPSTYSRIATPRLIERSRNVRLTAIRKPETPPEAGAANNLSDEIAFLESLLDDRQVFKSETGPFDIRARIAKLYAML